MFANKLKAESELLRCEKSVLDKVINNHHMEVTKQKNEISQLSRTLKIKEKEIYNLRNKELNQQDSIKNLKVNLKEIKAEKTQIEKETTKLKKKHLRKHDLNDTNENVKTVDKETETHMFVAQPACVDLQAFTKLPALTDMSSSTPSSTTCSSLIPTLPPWLSLHVITCPLAAPRPACHALPPVYHPLQPSWLHQLPRSPLLPLLLHPKSCLLNHL